MRLVSITIVLMLAGCASDPQIVAVKTELAPAPSACRAASSRLPKLPDRELTPAELAADNARIAKAYASVVGRYRLCQRYVARLHKG